MYVPFNAGYEVGHADAVTLHRYTPSQNPHLRTPTEPKRSQTRLAGLWAEGYQAGWIDGSDGTKATS